MAKWVIVVIILYLLVGVAFVAILQWCDRHDISDDDMPWLDSGDKEEVAITVLLWPMVLGLLMLHFIFITLPYLIFKGVMVICTTIVYLLKAIWGIQKNDK